MKWTINDASSGQGVLEYALILLGVGLAAILTLNVLGVSVNDV